MLTLPIRGKWFQMIISGQKKEEYRERTPYYESRLKRFEGHRISVRFRNGYSEKSPAVLCEVIPRRGQPGKPEWGAEEGKLYWVLEILKVWEG